MSHTLLVFGDSNSHGSPPIVTPGEYLRFDTAIRWPRVMARALGEGWTVVEEGLPGRTTQFDDPVMGAHMNGQTGLRIALESHGPIDLLVDHARHQRCQDPVQPDAGAHRRRDRRARRHRPVRADADPPRRLRGAGDLPAAGGRGRPDLAASSSAGPRSAPASPRCWPPTAPPAAWPSSTPARVIEVSTQDGIHFEPDAHQALGAGRRPGDRPGCRPRTRASPSLKRRWRTAGRNGSHLTPLSEFAHPFRPTGPSLVLKYLGCPDGLTPLGSARRTPPFRDRSVAKTGAWSDGCSQPRTARSTRLPCPASAISGVAQTWSSRRPLSAASQSGAR